jgi:polyisoprenoid-binding protein YceI
MNASNAKSLGFGGRATLGCALLLSVAVALPHQQVSEALASQVALTIDPAKSKVRWIVDSTLHTVHGTFNLKSGTLRFDHVTGQASGEIAVSAASGESGNNSRDARMHKEILETAKYPDVVFRPIQVDGKVSTSGPSDVNLRGILSIHGVDHDLVAPVHAYLAGDHWTGTTKFEIPYVKWGIKDPSNFLLKVKPVVTVELELSGQVQSLK